MPPGLTGLQRPQHRAQGWAEWARSTDICFRNKSMMSQHIRKTELFADTALLNRSHQTGWPEPWVLVLTPHWIQWASHFSLGLSFLTCNRGSQMLFDVSLSLKFLDLHVTKHLLFLLLCGLLFLKISLIPTSQAVICSLPETFTPNSLTARCYSS